MKTKRSLISLIALVVLVLALALVAGCGKKQTPIETEPALTTPPSPPVQVKPVTPEPVEPVDTRDWGKMTPAEMGINDVFFAYDSFDIDDAGMRALAQNARVMKDHADVVVMVEGHCDERGTVEYNLALGEKRAKGVREYLVSLGVSAAQLRVTTYGENKPFATGSTEEAWAQNRRAHFARP
jgi:peptidoglycan-associated lipoprotein